MTKRTLLTLLVAAFIGTGVNAVSAQKVNKKYEEFRDEACQIFLERSKKVNEEFKLGNWPRWDYKQETGELIFSEKGIPKVIAKVQAAGSWSKLSDTWMWAWQNSSLLPLAKKDVEKVRKFGIENKFAELADPQWACDKEYAWTVTAAAGHLLKAKTAFRAPYENGALYLLVFDIRWVEKD
jgi:hypothetical protein